MLHKLCKTLPKCRYIGVCTWHELVCFWFHYCLHWSIFVFTQGLLSKNESQSFWNILWDIYILWDIGKGLSILQKLLTFFVALHVLAILFDLKQLISHQDSKVEWFYLRLHQVIIIMCTVLYTSSINMFAWNLPISFTQILICLNLACQWQHGRSKSQQIVYVHVVYQL